MSNEASLSQDGSPFASSWNEWSGVGVTDMDGPGRRLEFSLKELSGAMGDWGTLLPIAISFMAINEMHPSHFMVVFGVTNIVTGIVYRLPMPLQPMKAVAAAAIAGQWSADLISATALSMGIFWLLLGLSDGVQTLIQRVPHSVTRGIQLALGIVLGWSGVMMVVEHRWWLGLIVLALIVILNRRATRSPTAVIVVGLGLFLMLYEGTLLVPLSGMTFPHFAWPDPRLAWEGFIRGGLAQIPLTLANAVIACCALVREYFPQRHVPERRLMLNTGVMNIGASLVGGFPMCHGAGGLASHYYFGARTGGANVMEGALEVILGIFLGTALLSVFVSFPMAILGAMLIMVGIELGQFSKRLHRSEWPAAAVTVILGVAFNLGVGFLGGLVAHGLYNRFARMGSSGEN